MSVQFAPSAQARPAVASATTDWALAGEGAKKPPSGLLAAGPAQHFAQDQQIFGDCEDAEFFFEVVAGVVRTCKFLSDGRRQIEAFHVPGDLVGFEAGTEYSVTAEAVSDCSLLPYRRRGIDAQLTKDETVTRQIFGHTMQSLARARGHSLLLGRRSAVEKVAAFLIDWARQSSDGLMATLAMTRQDIADYLGLTIETVSRTLSQLERDGMIELPALRQIRLKDLTALRNMNA